MIGRLTAAVSLAVLSLAVTFAPALPQEAPNRSAPSPELRELGDALSHYYEKPFDIVQFLAKWEQYSAPAREGIIGFLAGVFAKSPDEIRKVTAATNLGRRAQEVVLQGLRLAIGIPRP
jgi:hypothetical protein